MADPRKNQIVVVILILGYLSVPAYCSIQDLQQYTQEISRRSFAMMDGLFDSEGLLLKIGYPIFIILTFLSALQQLLVVLTGLIPGMGGLGMSLGSPLALFGFPGQGRTETARDQRLLDHVEDKVRSSVAAGQAQYENDLKKK